MKTVTYTAHVYNGLDHYTATVTEAKTLLGAKRAVSSAKYGAKRATLTLDGREVAYFDGRRWADA